MTKFKEKPFMERWKEVFAVIASFLGIVVAIFTIWEKLNPKFRIPALALSGILICIYVIYRRLPSSLKPNSLRPLFESSIRNMAVFLLIVLSLILVLWPFFYFPQSAIERINPIDPVAGAKLQIFGRNFPDSSSIEIEFGRTKVSNYYTVGKNYIEIRVPENVTSGPLHLKGKRRILPDKELIYSIVSIQKAKDDVVLITEDIRSDKDHFQVLFAALNTTEHRKITIYDIQLEIVALKDLGSPNYQQERINLGIVSIFKHRIANTTMDILTQPKIHLLNETHIIKLTPMSSESFHFRLQRPAAQHKMKIIFVISIKFFDDSGNQGTVFGNRFFAINTSDISGISISDQLPLNEVSYRKLKQEYGKAFRDFER